MSEDEWVASDDPLEMLRHFNADSDLPHLRPPSDRKLRLFACVCGFHQHTGELRQRQAESLALGERMAEGERVAIPANLNTWNVLRPSALEAASDQIQDARMGPTPDENWRRAAALLREIVGSPFQPVSLPMPPLFGIGLEIRRLAEAAYEHRLADGTLDPARLAILTDALLESGCASTPLIQHLRGSEECWEYGGEGDHCGRTTREGDTVCVHGESADGWRPLRGPHVRGCWVIDLLLGKQ